MAVKVPTHLLQHKIKICFLSFWKRLDGAACTAAGFHLVEHNSVFCDVVLIYALEGNIIGLSQVSFLTMMESNKQR